MKVNGISNHTQNFGGVAGLFCTQESKIGYPHTPDIIDHFRYIPFADDSEEQIDKEMKMLQVLNEGPKPIEIEPDKFIMKESAIEVKRVAPMPIPKRVYVMNKGAFSHHAFLDLFEIAESELKSRLAYLKKHTEKFPVDNLSNEVAKYFRWR